mmetsp:Transcript_5302/g.11749  ORF Transcript_5302/g.11749 Transcript_5302/m.11749 type:complete len:267 (+) Transcript_5302:1032-1832(+)
MYSIPRVHPSSTTTINFLDRVVNAHIVNDDLPLGKATFRILGLFAAFLLTDGRAGKCSFRINRLLFIVSRDGVFLVALVTLLIIGISIAQRLHHISTFPVLIHVSVILEVFIFFHVTDLVILFHSIVSFVLVRVFSIDKVITLNSHHFTPIMSGIVATIVLFSILVNHDFRLIPTRLLLDRTLVISLHGILLLRLKPSIVLKHGRSSHVLAGGVGNSEWRWSEWIKCFIVLLMLGWLLLLMVLILSILRTSTLLLMILILQNDTIL